MNSPFVKDQALEDLLNGQENEDLQKFDFETVNSDIEAIEQQIMFFDPLFRIFFSPKKYIDSILRDINKRDTGRFNSILNAFIGFSYPNFTIEDTINEIKNQSKNPEAH